MSFRLLALALGATLLSAGSFATKTCAPNEEYRCALHVEEKLLCEYWKTYKTDYSMLDCKTKDCYCQKDYVRDSTGKCIPCPKNNCPIYSTYKKEGSKATCQNPRPVTSSTPGCYCNQGYVLDATTQACIPWSKCPCPGLNQIYSDCVPKYPKTCNHHSNSSKHDVCLPDMKGCVCKPHHALNDDMVCVPIKDCPPTPCEVRCAKKGYQKYVASVKEIRCNSSDVAGLGKPGCQCDEGYARDSADNCIPYNQCPCPAYSVFAIGVSACPETCANLNGVRCLALKESGCECISGYVLNSQNQCVRKDDCCPYGQEYTKNSIQHNCNKPDVNVKNGCVCSNGKWLDENTQSCVDPDKCKCPKNMEYNACGACNRTCDNKNPICDRMCHPGCFCKKNFILDKVNGKCIREEKCSKNRSSSKHHSSDKSYSKSNSKESYSRSKSGHKEGSKPKTSSELHGIKCQPNSTPTKCKNTCPSKCPTKFKDLHVCLLTKKCQIGCDCNKGYLLNHENQCVLPKQCPPIDYVPPVNCELQDPNSEYSESHTCERVCTDLSPNPFNQCYNQCICKSGYVRGVDNTCIEVSKCPVDCGTNATYREYVNQCGRTCKTHKLAPFILCKLAKNPGCDCDPDYVTNEVNGQCVKISDCPAEECPPDTYKTKTSRLQTCDDISIKSIHLREREDCFCADPLVYNTATGKCIDASTCPNSPENQKCAAQDPNSEYVTKFCIGPNKQCGGGCVCKKGFFQNKQGKCVCGPNSIYGDLVNNCGNTCDTYYMAPFIRCKAPVSPGCQCNSGFVQNSEGHCVDIDACTKDELSCPSPMHYDECYRPKTCMDYITNNNAHKTGCFCDEPNVFDESTLQCVAPKDCPSEDLKCKINDVFSTFTECASSTDITCENPNGPITKDCRQRCVCQDGYIYKSKTSLVCIPKDQCKAIDTKCPAGQHYEPRFCSAEGCNGRISFFVCQAGCVCNDGLVLNEDGKCIPKHKCPKIYKETSEADRSSSDKSDSHSGDHHNDRSDISYQFHKQNRKCQMNDKYSMFTECGSSTDITCENPDGPVTADCRHRCVCQKDYIYESKANMVCIPKEKCQHRCPANQTYQECAACGRSCSNYYLNVFFKCACIPGCACKDGYIKNSKNECVAVEDCTEEETACQETQAFCSAQIQKTCRNPRGNGIFTAGCFCLGDLVYDEDSRTCKDVSECPKLTE